MYMNINETGKNKYIRIREIGICGNFDGIADNKEIILENEMPIPVNASPGERQFHFRTSVNFFYYTMRLAPCQ